MARTIHTGNSIRGSRVGSGPYGEPEWAIAAPRVLVSYWCSSLHEVRPAFSIAAKIPETWPCSCGKLAGQDKGNPPPEPQFLMLRSAQEKTHYQLMRDRRSAEDGKALIEWALTRCHAARARRRAKAAAREAAVRRDRADVEVEVEVQLDVVPAPLALPAGEVVSAVPLCPATRHQPRRLSRAQRHRAGSIRQCAGKVPVRC